MDAATVNRLIVSGEHTPKIRCNVRSEHSCSISVSSASVLKESSWSIRAREAYLPIRFIALPSSFLLDCGRIDVSLVGVFFEKVYDFLVRGTAKLTWAHATYPKTLTLSGALTFGVYCVSGFPDK